MLLLPAKLAKRARHIEEQHPITERLASNKISFFVARRGSRMRLIER
jgi:hypothetical protein